MSTTRTPICAKTKHQELLRNFHPQTSPSKLTFFKNTFYIFIANIAGKILLSSSLNPWDSLPRIELTRKEKREKHTISGLFQFQSSPNFIPWFPFFRTMLRVPTVLHAPDTPSSNVTEFSWISWRSFESVQPICSESEGEFVVGEGIVFKNFFSGRKKQRFGFFSIKKNASKREMCFIIFR